MKQHFKGARGQILSTQEISYAEAAERVVNGLPVVWSHKFEESYPSGRTVEYVHCGSNHPNVQFRATVWQSLSFPVLNSALRVGEWKFGVPTDEAQAPIFAPRL